MLIKQSTMLQLLTTVFNHITHGFPSFTLKAPIKVSGDYWGKTSGELELIVRDNELVCGVIDKAQFGKFGIVHTFQELYGPEMAGRLLSVFSRLFTAYLQVRIKAVSSLKRPQAFACVFYFFVFFFNSSQMLLRFCSVL